MYITFVPSELKLTVSNDSLAGLLNQEQVKVQRLLEELRTVKSSNATEIRRLKNELASLRKVMISYINQIDSLNRLTAQQKQVIAEVTQKYNDASRQISNLSEEKSQLNKKVTLAAQLDATNIWVEPKNKRDKRAKKVKDVVKFNIGFTIVKNITAEAGERTLYIRITKPDNDVLTKSSSNTFTYENRTLNYSIKKYIEYNGEEQQIVVYWNVEEFLYAGNYRVDIFADGTLIGSQRFALE
jgi:DNA repair exonuclease SbcCD ATPase subunit